MKSTPWRRAQPPAPEFSSGREPHSRRGRVPARRARSPVWSLVLHIGELQRRIALIAIVEKPELFEVRYDETHRLQVDRFRHAVECSRDVVPAGAVVALDELRPERVGDEGEHDRDVVEVFSAADVGERPDHAQGRGGPDRHHEVDMQRSRLVRKIRGSASFFWLASRRMISASIPLCRRCRP